MAKRVYNKLVRDKIPGIVKTNGFTPITRALDDQEFLEALNKKLVEEMEEYLESYEMEELADIYEVLLAILDIRNISIDEFEKIRYHKIQERGNFQNKVFLISVEE